jgi:hypothetical protein
MSKSVKEELVAPESDYKDLVKQNQDADRARINDLAVLSQENRTALQEAVKFTNYHPDPITAPFQRKYILSDLEFATEESRLAQSVTELNVRTENLMNDAYSYKKTELEIEKLELEKQFKLGELEEPQYKRMLGGVEADLLELEIANKKVSLRKIKLQSNARFKEAMAWKQNVEESLSLIGKNSIDDVDLDKVRMELMRAKISKWGELYAEGSFEMTPSKLQAIKSEEEAFQEGFNIGTRKMQELKMLKKP